MNVDDIRVAPGAATDGFSPWSIGKTTADVGVVAYFIYLSNP